MNTPSAHAPHPIVGINHIPRIIGGSFMFAIMASILYVRDNPPYLWGCAGFCLVWPHMAFQISRRSRRSKQTEILNMHVDAFFFGFFIPIAHFQLWVAMTFTNLLISNCIRIGGVRLLGSGGILYIIGGLTAIGLEGIVVVPAGNTITTVLCITMLTLYFTAMSVFSFNMTRKLVHSKTSLEKAHHELKMESEERKKAMDAQAELETQLLHSRKMESIGTLTEGIAHHFSNIVSTIIENTETARDELLPSHPAYPCLDEIFNTGHRAKEIVNQLSSFTHKARMKRKSVHLVPLVQNTMEFIKSTIPSNVEIRHDFHPIEGVIFADPNQIQQVLINLCANASRAMIDNNGILEISAREVSPERNLYEKFPDLVQANYVELRVEDTGHGISPEILDRIFDPFFTTWENGQSSGMGLSVVHGIVKSHGGAVSVNSKPGKGTIVNVFLPVLPDKNPATKPSNFRYQA